MSLAQASLKRVRRGFATLVAGAGAVGLLAAGWLAHEAYTSELVSQTAARLELVASTQQTAVRTTVRDWEDRVERFSREAGFAAAARAYLDSPTSSHRADLDRHFAGARSAVPELRDIALADPDGRVVAATRNELVDRDMTGRPGFVRGNAATTTGDLEQGDGGQILVTVVSPLEVDGEPAGMVWMLLDADELIRITRNREGLGASGETLLVQRSWRGDAVLVTPARFDREAAFRQATRPNRLDRPATHALREGDLVLHDGVVDYRGVPVIAATRYLPERDWGIVVKIDRQEALRPAMVLRDRLVLAGGAVVVLMLLGGHLVTRSLIRPLRQMRDQMDATLAAIADGIVTIDGRGVILSVNPATEAIFGYGAEEIVGRNVGVLMPEAERAEHDDHLAAYRRTGVGKAVGHRREVAGRHKNGDLIPLEIAVSEVTIAGRRCFTGLVEDVSFRKRAEEQIERQSAELVRTNEKLAGRNDELRRLYRTAQQFIDNVSHDFRTPLNVIGEYASIMRDGSLGSITDEQGEFLDTIMQRTADLTIMVNDALDLSKLDAGLLGVVRRPCSLEQVIAGCRSGLNSQAAAVHADLQIALPPDLPQIFADPEKIGRVIVNLGVNACKFTEDGGAVRLWARHDADAAQVVIGVTDDGPGISPEHLRAIFERFQQVGDVKKSAKGFGLGLAIVKELVELNLGHVSVESREGEGSTFWFTVPTTEPLFLIKRFLGWTRRLRPGSRYLTLIAVELDARGDEKAVREVDTILRRTLRFADLVLPPRGHRWLVVAAIEQPDPSGIQHRIRTAIEDAGRHRGGGALPVSTLESLGTWSLAEGGDALRERVEAEYGRAPRQGSLARRAA